MQRLLASLVAVVEANQRQLLWGVLRQLALLSAAGFGLWQLSGLWWWLCLVLFGAFLLGGALLAFYLFTQFQLRLEPPWRAIAMQPFAAAGEKSGVQQLELHGVEGGVTMLRVVPVLVAEVLSAAREAGLEVVTGPSAVKALQLTSARLERLRDIEALLPHVPTPDLRRELSALIARVRALEPTGCDELLRELEIQLMAEEQAQTTTSLRGPKPVYEKELRAKLAALTKRMDEAQVIDTES